MMKKLISMLLSLLICLSLLPTQALADDGSEENGLPTVIETPAPNEPDDPITVMCMMPGYTGSGERPTD